jgi:5-methylcytosine-specific restriction endonuclease McrA
MTINMCGYHTFQLENWKSSEIAIFKLFHFRCARCPAPAVTLHEIEPKYKGPKDWDDPMNRIPLCMSCHQWAHNRGTKFSKAILTVLRKEAEKNNAN